MRGRRRKDNDVHQLQVVDVGALRSVLDAVLERFPSHRRAAAALGIGQPTFTRLLLGATKKTQKRIGAATYKRICEALLTIDLGLDPLEQLGFREQFRDSVLPWAARGIQGHYDHWVGDQLRRLEKKVVPILRQLLEHQEYRQLVRRFHQKVARRSDQASRKKRLLLALYRTAEPLAAAGATYGVERSWQEMHAVGQLTLFLKAGLRREEILLDRELDHDRFANLTPPEEYFADLADPDDRPMSPAQAEKFFEDAAKATDRGNDENA